MKAKKRLFPALSLLLVIILTLSAVNVPAMAYVTQAQIDALKTKQSAIADSKKELEGQIAGLGTEMTSLMERKAALDQQNELTQQEIELINEQIALYDQLIEQKARELEEAKKAEQDQKQALRVRMRAMEESGNLSYISILLNASNFTDLLSRLDCISSIMERDSELADEYVAAREHVAEVKADYEATQESQKATRTELEAKKAELEADIDEATALITQLEADIAAYKTEYEQSEAEAAAIAKQIDDLVAALEEQNKVIVGTGRLIWPLPGYSYGDADYGPRLHPILGYWRPHNGEDIAAPTGTPILAADGGTVLISSYNAGGYGNYVSISHGNGYVTLYGHMNSRAVAAGDTVTQGQIIGYVGSTGLSSGAHLHFEVRVNGSYTDPKSYFSF